jgi:phosphorylcholine metabolism protein LicD
MYGSRYVLDRNQLSFMVDSLSSNSAEMDYGLMKIIFTHAYSYGIYPYKKSDFLKKIESLVKNTKMKSDKNLRVILIWALGLYEKPSVVENLKADLIDFNQELMGLNQEKRVEKLVEKRRDYESAYMQPVTSKVIEANRSELFDFQRQLEKSGKKEASLLLSQIRRKAAEDVRLKRFDEPIKMPDSVQSVIYSNVIL